jgi:clan AA aspartic protease
VRPYFDEFGQPRVEIEVRGSQARVQVEALLDTGFDGELSLPVGIAIQLGLELRDVVAVELADGTIRDELVFRGHLIAEGREVEISLLLTHGQEPLMGTGLLRDRRVVLDFGRGEAEISPSRA